MFGKIAVTALAWMPCISAAMVLLSVPDIFPASPAEPEVKTLTNSIGMKLGRVERGL